jgi:hypothetical protein
MIHENELSAAFDERVKILAAHQFLEARDLWFFDAYVVEIG